MRKPKLRKQKKASDPMARLLFSGHCRRRVRVNGKIYSRKGKSDARTSPATA